MKNISKNYFELKIVQSDKISKVDTFALKKEFPLIYDMTFSLNLWDKKYDNLKYEKKFDRQI